MFLSQQSHRLLHRAAWMHTQFHHPSSLPFAVRPITTTPTRLHPRKNSQDKDSLSPRAMEYSQTGGDDVAAEFDAAFDPNKTRPEQEKTSAESEQGGGKDPLQVSPANKEVSKPRDEQEGGAQGSPRTSQSAGGSAPKAGGGKSG